MNELESLLREAATTGLLQESRLRILACMYCRRIMPLCPHPMSERVLRFAEMRASGSFSRDELRSLRAEAVLVYESLYPGHGPASSRALAFSAVGEAAFTEDSLTLALNASSTAAEAKGVAAAERVSEMQFDVVHDAAYSEERKAQLLLLRQMIDALA